MKIQVLNKEQYRTKKDFILTNPSLTVCTQNKPKPKKFEHTNIVSSELGKLILHISNSCTKYYFEDSNKPS